MTITIPIRATEIESVPVDHDEVARLLAAADSTTQAEFFLAFWEEVSDMQILYIGDERAFGSRNESTRAEVADVFMSLAEAIRTGGKA
jgi:hypothetical protein